SGFVGGTRSQSAPPGHGRAVTYRGGQARRSLRRRATPPHPDAPPPATLQLTVRSRQHGRAAPAERARHAGLLGAPGRRFAPRECGARPSRAPCGPASTVWVEPSARACGGIISTSPAPQ
ncbi:MAG TPA: hypothetical protein VFW03_18840, partial [Gemmatimonadaceae bacterium]|nr:hypothetical protein [Gemmatimonadaceae bacterium]